MAETTGIQWTDATDNIIVAAEGGWWCRKISPGCLSCYAEKLNQSTYFHGNKRKYAGDAPVLKLREDIIDRWARMRAPRKHFVSSMTDVFGDWLPQSWIFRFLDGMADAPSQTFQVLTKRASEMRQEVDAWLSARGLSSVPSNIWLGVSVENQAFADSRIPHLLQIPAAVRFLSVEPLLGPVDILQSIQKFHDEGVNFLDDVFWKKGGIDWVIVGGESGPGARPCDVGWIRSIVAQCKAGGVPCFVKQLGAVPMEPEEHWRGRVVTRLLNARNRDRVPDGFVPLATADSKGGDWTDWPSELRVREFPEVRS